MSASKKNVYQIFFSQRKLSFHYFFKNIFKFIIFIFKVFYKVFLQSNFSQQSCSWILQYSLVMMASMTDLTSSKEQQHISSSRISVISSKIVIRAFMIPPILNTALGTLFLISIIHCPPIGYSLVATFCKLNIDSSKKLLVASM